MLSSLAVLLLAVGLYVAHMGGRWLWNRLRSGHVTGNAGKAVGLKWLAGLMIVLALIVMLVSHVMEPDTYPGCLIDKLSSAQNDAVARQAAGLCLKEFPLGYNRNWPQKEGWLHYNSGAECTIKKAKDTVSPVAADAIQVACYKLYEIDRRTMTEKFGIPPMTKEQPKPEFDPSTAKPTSEIERFLRQR